MKEKLLSVLMVLLTGSAVAAQDVSSFKVLSDSAYKTDAVYMAYNKYQKDAVLFMDMVADTHPYYIKAERRAKWLEQKPTLLERCKSVEADEDFADALINVLGPLHDKHTDVTTSKRLQEQRAAARQDVLALGAGDIDREHIMRPHASNYDYQLFPDQSICYLQFNKCTDAANFPFPNFLNQMFGEMEAGNIRTLVVDVQYNNGGSSRLCDQLFMYLYPLGKTRFFTQYLRFSDLMAAYNPRIAEAKKNWERDGHKDELYQMPAPKIPDSFQQPKLFEGQVVFVMGKRTFSSAGMLLTNARDHHVGTIIGTNSTFSPSHYGEVLPFRLPNTNLLGSISCKYFARPDAATADEPFLRPDVEINLDDKDAAWRYIVEQYGSKQSNCDAGWLWEVSGNGLTQNSYLFGTCHGDGHQFTKDEMFNISGLENALGKVETVLFEGGIDTTDIAKVVKAEMEKFGKWLKSPERLMPEGTYYKPLYDTIAHFNEVNKFLYYKMKDPEYWKKNPGYWFSRLSFYDMLRQRQEEVSIDRLLEQEVSKRGIGVGYVEKNTEGSLFSMLTDVTSLDTIPMKRQANMLYHYIHDVLNNDSLLSIRGGISEAYMENDTCKFADYMRSIGAVPGAESGDDANHEILHDRNVLWIPVIKENITARSCMIAVGCRHLMGSESLIALLRWEGYAVKPVKNK